MLNFFFGLFGFASAICFGTGDFTGGYITKKSNVFLVLFFSQLVGFIFLVGCIIVFNEQLNVESIFISLISGIFGAFGLLAFYRGLSMGNMGIVAPITSVVTPIVPFLYSVFQLEYSITQIAGIILALIAIWLVSSSKLQKRVSYIDIVLAIIAGICLGLYLVFINLASTTNYFYPILFARISSLCMISIIILLNKTFIIPQKNSFLLMALVGILDTSGNVFFILSSRAGRVDFASIILSLGPVVTVLLAWKLLHERLTKIQSV